MTPYERDLINKVNAVYSILAEIHSMERLAANAPLMLCGHVEEGDYSMVVTMRYLPGRHEPKDLLAGQDYTAIHLRDKPELSIVPKD